MVQATNKIFWNTQTKQKWHALNPPVTERQETEPPATRLITQCASAHGLFRLETPWAWGSRNMKRWKRKVPKKEQSSQKEGGLERWRSCLEVTCWMEVGERSQRCGRWRSGDVHAFWWWHPRLVAASTGRAGTNTTLCPAFPVQQLHPYWEGQWGARECKAAKEANEPAWEAFK